MTEQTMLIQCLKHYCDTIWEYDRITQKIFIHYDLIAREHKNRSYTVHELIHLFKEKYKLNTNEYMWKHYLNETYLQDFFEKDAQCEKFEVQFIADNTQLMWYAMRIERAGDNTLMISGKNIYNEFKERSLYESVKESYENLISIHVQTKTCVIVHAKYMASVSAKTYDYDSAIKEFADKRTAEDNKEELKNKLSLACVLQNLENAPTYVVYVNVLLADGQKSCKKITFSYTDKTKNFITLATLNIDEIVTRYEHLLKEIRKENLKDSLTGAYNRNYYEMNIKHQSLTGAVAVFDIDDFKLCNDTRGHSAGDAVLYRVADVIRSEIDDTDILIRYGGDEFLLLTKFSTQTELEKKLGNIKKHISKSNINAEDGFPVSLSMGAAIAKNEVAQDVVERADKLMYRAKLHKNSFVTEQAPSPTADASDRTNLKQQILVVDDSPINREILSRMIRDDFDILEAKDGRECMNLLREYGTGISLILLDIIMPEMDGFEVLTEMNRLHYIDDIPVIMISVDGSDTNIRRAFSLGVTDCITRPYDAQVVMQRIYNTVKLYAKQRRLTSIITRQLSKTENNSRILVDVLSGILGRKNGESALHVQRIRKITSMILERLVLKTDKYALSRHDCEMIAEAAVLHDIGKIEIDNSILNKPGKLTDAEREIVKKHTTIGEEILLQGAGASIKTEPMLETAAQICRWHHERYDGNGYPDGLSGEEIPIAAQVVSIADVYDALVSRRAYKEAFSPQKALNMILSGECGSFNPLLTESLCEISEKLAKQ